MSAFIVDYKTIDNILSVRLNHNILVKYCYLESEFDSLFYFDDGLPHWQSDFYLYDNLEKLGKEFLRLNIESVEARYPGDEDINMAMEYAENYKFKSVDNISLGQALKSLNCLMYQSCEIDKYQDNPIWKKMEELKKYLTDAFINLNDEYKNAAWSDSY